MTEPEQRHAGRTEVACHLCQLIAGGVVQVPSRQDDTLYKVLRDEMIESFTRMTHARNWSMVLAAGVAAVVVRALVLWNDRDPSPSEQTLIALVLLVASVLTVHFARFVCSACSTSSDIGIFLLALECRNGLHFWNEHESWQRRMAERGLACPQQWADFLSRPPTSRVPASDILFDPYFLLTAVYALGAWLIQARSHDHQWYLTTVAGIASACWVLTLVFIRETGRDFDRCLYDFHHLHDWMVSGTRPTPRWTSTLRRVLLG